LDKLKDSLVIASRNRDKFREIQEKLRALPLAVLSLADFPFVEEVVEDQPDLYGNAVKKATEVSRQTGLWALADDTGLEVNALNGEPGVLSARYSGREATYESNCRKLLSEMRGVPDEARQARFRTVACLRTHDGLFCVEGKVEGTISREKRGDGGFGYDPVFVLPSGLTMAELDLEEKNRISHRGQAMERMAVLIRFLLVSA
jgi:XTP/dITP diphosphohydrolase